MNLRNSLISVCLVSLLSGCALFRSPVPPPNPIVAPPVAPVVAATADLSTKEAEVKEKVAANVENARKSNAKQALGPITDTVESELALAASRLAVAPDPAELLFGEQRARAFAEGKTEEARKMYADATKQATEEAKARAEAEARLQKALEDSQIAAATYQKDLDALKREQAKALEDARNEVMRDQVKWLNRSGAALSAIGIVILGLAIGFGGLVGIKALGPLSGLLVLGSLFCFGLAQIVGQWWFKWAILGSFLTILGLVGVWVYNRYHAGTLALDTQEKANKLLSVSKKVIPILDQAYDAADSEAKALLDRLIFSKLSSKMDAADKNTVLELKKEL